jgi:hypothetical protein
MRDTLVSQGGDKMKFELELKDPSKPGERKLIVADAEQSLVSITVVKETEVKEATIPANMNREEREFLGYASKKDLVRLAKSL